MATEGKYVPLSGIVQHFKGKDVLNEREVNDGEAIDFTIKLFGKDTLVRVTIFDSLPIEAIKPLIVRGASVDLDGKLSASEKNGTTYFNYTANSIVVGTPFVREEREVVNRKSSDGEASSADDALAALVG